MLTSIARTCYRRRWRVLLAWVGLVVGLSAVGSAVANDYRMDFSLPGTETEAATRLLKRGGFGDRAGYTGQLVAHAPDGVMAPAAAGDLERLVDQIRAAMPDVGVRSPFDPGGEAQVSDDGAIAFAELDFGDIPLLEAQVLAEGVREVRDKFVPSSGASFELGGDLFVEESEFSSEGFGMIAAIVILLAAFGSVLAMGLPVLTALFGIACGFAIVSIATTFMDIPDFTPAAVAMIGIGVGIDYALFIVTRYREELATGASPESAVERAINTAGRAVLFAGATVVISLLGLVVVGLASTRSLAVAAASGVLMVMLASLTLLPALLGFVGRNIDRLRIPHLRHRNNSGLWRRWSRVVQRRPWPIAVASTFVLLTLAAPAFGMRLGFSDTGNRPVTDTSRRAYDLLADGFGPGFNGPLFLAVGNPDRDPAVLDRLRQALDADPDIALALPPFVNDTGEVALVQAFPTTSPQDEATVDLVQRLRDDVLPDVTAGTGGEVLVGGPVAAAVDFGDLQAARLPIFIGVVLVLSFLLLMVTFRSILVPFKAVVMNLLSIGAAYGVLVAVFQWGWAADLLGVNTGPVEAWAPMMLFAIVFGLSMDYEVFLLSRIKEEYDRAGDNAAAVAHGLANTARLITAAAAIMICVFGGFVLSAERSLQIFGLGLAVAVLIDATIVRLLLVPATMELLGDRNWWLPRALDRRLPKVDIEHAPAGAATTGGPA
jgi:RND superfamily putative drug exporter